MQGRQRQVATAVVSEGYHCAARKKKMGLGRRRSHLRRLAFGDVRIRRVRGIPLSMGELRCWSCGGLMEMGALGCSGRFGGRVWMEIVLRTWWI